VQNERNIYFPFTTARLSIRLDMRNSYDEDNEMNKQKIIKKLQKDCTKLWAEQIHARDGICQLCGKQRSQGKLDAHHIFSKAGHQNVRYDLDNGILLCFYCHRVKTHQQGGQDLGLWLVCKHGQEWYDNLRSKAKITVQDKLEHLEKAREILTKGERNGI
jgi:5-methylcytosine-specific restriction endonuclease McrA